MLIGDISAEAIAEAFHAGIAGPVHQIPDLIVDFAKIFRDDPHAGNFPLQGFKEGTAWTILPPAVPGVRCPIGNGIIVTEADEVIDPHDIEKTVHGLHPVHPPEIALLLQIIPAVKGIAPELAVLREAVRRHAGDPLGDAVFIQLKNLRVRPGVRRIFCHIDGHIPEEEQTAVIAVFLQGKPLAHEDHLAEQVEVDLFPEHAAVQPTGKEPVIPDALFRPAAPHFTAEIGFDGGEKGKIGGPAVFPAEGVQLRPEPIPALPESPAEERFLGFPGPGVVGPLRIRRDEDFAVVIG